MGSDKCDEKVLTFFELLKRNKVEIPIIQRDYAQGRSESNTILEHFLGALRDSITSRVPVRLDFIYGNVVNDYFQPLDGQQRLTTLYLLHWYAYMRNISNLGSEERDLLLKFTYETRISSREFCKELVSRDLDINDPNQRISDTIVESNWFFLSWKKDPTIKSMLNCLDKIHALFYDIGSLWDRLVNERFITFYYVELENIGLTDDLYIRMNARGKLLSSFENFKASLQKKATEESWESTLGPTQVFSFRMDTDWTDFFWNQYRREHSVDMAHMRFMTAIVMNQLAIGKVDERIQLIQRLNDHTEQISMKYMTKEMFEYIRRCYELYCETNTVTQNLNLPFPLWKHAPAKDLLSAIVYDEGQNILLQSDSTYTTKVLFYAQTEYLLQCQSFDHGRFCEWMRVVRNIISRGDIDKDGKRRDIIRSPQSFLGVIGLIHEISEGCHDIYDYLAHATVKSTFAREQMEEERKKAKLFHDDPSLKTLLWEAEDHELFKGSIKFLFYCIDYEEASTTSNVFDQNLFQQVLQVFQTYFNKDSDISPAIRRAFLCTCVDNEYRFYNYWYSTWILINATKRKLLDNYGELEYLLGSDQKEYVKNLVRALTTVDLKDYIANFVPPSNMPNWKIRLIKEDALLDQAKSNYIAISQDESCCYLLRSKRPRDTDGCIEIR